MKKKVISPDNYPAKCEYCKKSRPSPDGENMLCEKKGIVKKDGSCRSYKYDVLKRTPRKPEYDMDVNPEDFKL